MQKVEVKKKKLDSNVSVRKEQSSSSSWTVHPQMFWTVPILFELFAVEGTQKASGACSSQ